MTLTTHFTLAEAEHSDTADRLGIPNVMNEQQTHNAQLVALELERVRSDVFLNTPIKINSWYRSPSLNNVVGGSPTSYHKDGLAVDIGPAPGKTCDETQTAIAAINGHNWDLIMVERTADGKHIWIHCQLARTGEAARHLVRDAEVDQLGGTITRTLPG